jgi:DNA repair protein RecN (Recombination protein N)
MTNAQFHVDITEASTYEVHGKDLIEFQFSANRGIPMNPLHKIASGGELSRVALCIKSILADKTNLPTMIFDEVDSGVSGQVAMIMGQLIDDLSTKYQIVTITHSPQVAAQGNDHFLIYKIDQQDRSFTKVKKLTKEERVEQIAQMLGGESPSEAALTNARELLD